MVDKKRRKPVAVSTRPGHPMAPDPVRADYRQEIPEEVYELIDEQCDQDELSGGKTIEKFEW